MKNELINVNYRTEYTGIRTIKAKYIAEITHKGLNDFKVLTSDSTYILSNKVDSHIAKLDEKWRTVVSKQNVLKNKEENIKWAEERTQESVDILKSIENILIETVNSECKFDWEAIKNKSKFNIKNPKNDLEKQLSQISKPIEPIYLQKPSEPNAINFIPKLNFFEKLIESKKKHKIELANNLYQQAIVNWRNDCTNIETDNQNKKNYYLKTIADYEKQRDIVAEKNRKDILGWENLKNEFYSKQNEENLKVDALRKEYLECVPDVIVTYCELVLNNVTDSESFPKDFEFDYNPNTRILIVEYSLPTIEQFPTLNKVKYISGELKEYHLSEIQTNKLFDVTMYNIALRTLHLLFRLDIADALDAVSFNGWINAVNKATGNRVNNCIMSVLVKKAEFLEIDLKHVDPKVCFKTLKGVGSSTLSGITPIQPILQINKHDSRFIDSYNVANNIDNSTNLALMDWQDFEHLIREVFAKEFSSNGGEVKVTQASRDGGVDAVAFDPDPIRGGKIVIQAKRYTNTVGVNAVRDLYGTVINEGATKGILVTTTDYGPDAYDFIKGKPLTLLNGANLLFLLERHGHHAKIDIKEAKRLM